MIDTKGRSLELFYIDGHPDGMVTAELFNWTGHVFVTPRTRLAEALQREEAGYAGVYLLLGEYDGGAFAYIGEAEDLRARMKTHASSENKDWWETAVLVSASANRLNKAHVKYLEARMISIAKEIGHTPLQNSTTPSLPGLTEADVAKMEAFLANLMVVLPAIRVDMFIQRSRPAGSTAAASLMPRPESAPAEQNLSSQFVLNYPKYNIQAHAMLQNGEFIVQAGSGAFRQWQGTENHSYRPLFEELLRGGVIAPDGDIAKFVKDYAFSSPSAAAAMVYGRAANGPECWHEVTHNITYREWEARQLATVVSEDD
ncbi:methionine sulfoxide reductase [Parasaccharibacter sp. TMW2.1882]|uniref:GIY-YIG nuclease family protein n=1 Tax=unclassified Parasaccharibacter TaxID=2626400 RepID=UPI00200B097F|nr:MULTISPECIES: GIY-YIG nuclease family protein [unclassified Parasaccharibacter]MCK8637659.1 methionine sulfoxide reductase [Parasaccharibacter sp. TMW2.1885]MCL1496938.1 methionine sulfoxide reductase [Parasaccharibacter sp. TMW2.1882]MCT6836593.1 GIY-YIG nuclease family protein [Bifidobacteriales bacterium]